MIYIIFNYPSTCHPAQASNFKLRDVSFVSFMNRYGAATDQSCLSLLYLICSYSSKLLLYILIFIWLWSILLNNYSLCLFIPIHHNFPFAPHFHVVDIYLVENLCWPMYLIWKLICPLLLGYRYMWSAWYKHHACISWVSVLFYTNYGSTG